MGAFLEIGFELVPQFRRLILDVPFHVLVARTEVALLGARGLLVTADTDDNAGKMVLIKDRLEAIFFQSSAAFDTRSFALG